MTGEDMIIKAAAKVLREARDDEHAELRRVFWIAGYCEHCGAPHQNDGRMRCPNCKRAIVNRITVSIGPANDLPVDVPVLDGSSQRLDRIKKP